jgi:hypothetical protein
LRTIALTKIHGSPTSSVFLISWRRRTRFLARPSAGGSA